AVSFTLNNAGFTAEVIDTEAQLTMDTVDNKPTINAIRFTTRARVPNIDAALFATIPADAKINCVVSRALSPAIVVTLDAATPTSSIARGNDCTLHADQGPRRDVQPGESFPA